MKKFTLKANHFNLSIAIFIAISGMIVISSCSSTTSVTDREAYEAGDTIRRMITGE